MSRPLATYRLQLRQGVDLREARALVPYLERLGVTHLYLSPVLRARRGSTHGYDVVEPGALDPTLGSEDDLEALARELHAREMRLLLDVVPNHVGVGGDENAWWLDVLKYGARSPWAGHFDIDWDPPWPELRGRLLAPFLGEPLDRVLERGELALELDAARGELAARYYEHRFPLAPASVGGTLATPDAPEALRALGASLAAHARAGGGGHCARSEALEAGLARRLGEAPAERAWLERRLARLVADARSPAGRAPLARLLDAQHFVPSDWRLAAQRINYRRFFNISDLAGVRIECEEVFRDTHAAVLRWVRAGWVDGLRVDHVDGLADPRAYLERLRAELGPERLLLVEKILEPDERLPDDWPVDGTTGYEFLREVCGVLVDPAGRPSLEAAWVRRADGEADFERIVDASKRHVLRVLFPSELERSARDWVALAGRDADAEEPPAPGRAGEALVEWIVSLPVYRTYLDARGAGPVDRERIRAATRRAQERRPERAPELARLETLLLEAPSGGRALAFARRLQQLTGPVMAKALEDTAFYRHQRLVALNEVGGDPHRFGVAPDEWHARARERAVRWPRTLLATSTHDTKRGEDARARIAALSELADEWVQRVEAWEKANAHLVTTVEDERGARRAPTRSHEYLMYQSWLGSWPSTQPSGRIEPAALAAFAERAEAWAIKAAREGKQATSWRMPRDAYEDALAAFVRGALDPVRGREFLADFAPFQARVAAAGAVNGLAQLVLKLAAPGIPDLYQGTDALDLAFADPDNRRPLDRRAAEERLAAVVAAVSAAPGDERDDAVARLARSWRDGSAKGLVTHALLAARGRQPALFAEGAYRPLAAEGLRAAHVLAFERTRPHGTDRLVVAVARRAARLPRAGPEALPLGAAAWAETDLVLPALPGRAAPDAFHDLLLGRTLRPTDAGGGPGGVRLALAEVFALLPVAVLAARSAS